MSMSQTALERPRIDCRAEVAGSNRLPIIATTINEHVEAAGRQRPRRATCDDRGIGITGSAVISIWRSKDQPSKHRKLHG